MTDENGNIPLINEAGSRLAYAFGIARAANGYAYLATTQGGYNEPKESYRYTTSVLGKDMKIENGGDIQKYYIGRGEDSLVLSAALEVAIGVFATQINDVFLEPDPEKQKNMKRAKKLNGAFPGDEETMQALAQEVLTVSPTVAQFLAVAEQREIMRQRFPDANLSDERISQFLPQPL